MPNLSLDDLAIVLIPLLFIGVWTAVCLLMSLLGGWHRLAKVYPGRSSPTGKCFRMQSGSFGWVNYGNCLCIHTSPDGIDLAIMLPFRIGHPPLFIPWEAVENARVKSFLWVRAVHFDVGSPRIAKLSLPTKVFAEHPA